MKECPGRVRGDGLRAGRLHVGAGGSLGSLRVVTWQRHNARSRRTGRTRLALRMPPSLQKRQRERKELGQDREETLEPTRPTAGVGAEVGAVARFSPAQNEANRPAGAGAAQPQRPQVDVAAGDPAGGEKGASGEAKAPEVGDQRSGVRSQAHAARYGWSRRGRAREFY
jgi:hypothetical protein